MSRNIGTAGPLADVLIEIPSARAAMLRKHGLSPPEPVRTLVLIDTGATMSGLDPSVFAALDCGSPIDRGPIRTCGDVAITEFHFVDLTLVGADGVRRFPSLEVFGTEFSADEGARGLIGRDTLDHCHFVYDGPNGRSTLTF